MFPHVALNALEPGDLLFYDLDGSGIDHVVMYVGPYLDGQATPYGQRHHHPGRPHRHLRRRYDPIWYRGPGRGRPARSGRSARSTGRPPSAAAGAAA